VKGIAPFRELGFECQNMAVSADSQNVCDSPVVVEFEANDDRPPGRHARPKTPREVRDKVALEGICLLCRSGHDDLCIMSDDCRRLRETVRDRRLPERGGWTAQRLGIQRWA
jgi:hypothetical protein